MHLVYLLSKITQQKKENGRQIKSFVTWDYSDKPLLDKILAYHWLA